jgi:N-acetyl-anhydromuramyl-L-alanine amidase AmpD
MKSFFIVFCFFTGSVLAQNFNFGEYHQNYPLVPDGLIEAVAYTNTRMQVLDPNEQGSCTGMPKAYGILGLFDDQTPYFRQNGKLIATISGISIADQKSNPAIEIQAYAMAFQQLMEMSGAEGPNDQLKVYEVLKQLSEIPEEGAVNQFARDAQIYEILRFMNNEAYATTYTFTKQQFNLIQIFGAENLKVLSGKKTIIGSGNVQNEEGKPYKPNAQVKSTQYAPAIWNPAATCNFSSRNGTAISAITIHTVQGTYSGCISWFQNCSASVSAHYVIRSSDGQVTQMVDEANKAWHVGSENPYTIGYEHEGYVSNASWYTEAMYNSSADLSRDIINSGYGIPALRTYYGAASSGTNTLGNCTKIKGHQHYANQTHTDPGINWNWEKYYRLINNNPTIQTITTASGNFYDSGGAGGNYTDDERKIWVFEPTNATSVTLQFSSFNIEANWDYLFLYDGNSIDAPLIGVYTGTSSPGTVTSTGGSITVEFRSDCATVAAGWAVNYTSQIIVTDNTPPTTLIDPITDWITTDFQVNVQDADASGVVGKFALISDKDPSTGIWSANSGLGYAEELFDVNMANWTAMTGPFSVINGGIECPDAGQGNSNAYMSVFQNNASAYLYEWDQTFTSSGTNQRGGLHFFCDDPTLPNRGNSYFVFLRETDNQVQIFKVIDDVFTIMVTEALTIDPIVTYACKVSYEPTSGWIKFYVNGALAAQWQDQEPIQIGNSISLRTAGSSINYDNIRIYHSRGNSLTINVGPSGHMRYQGEGAIETGRIRSLALDLYDNWSAADSKEFLIDWSEPELQYLNDGPSNDIDTTYTFTLQGNWLAEDIHSGIGNYEVAIGVLPSLTNVMGWTDMGTTTSLSHLLTSPVYGTTYHISMRATNEAGLEALFVSNGQLLADPSAGIEDLLKNLLVYPNPFTNNVQISGLTGEFEVVVVDMQGKVVYSNQKFNEQLIDLSQLANGSYQMIIRQNGQFRIEKLIKQ